MIDPLNPPKEITASDYELQEFLMFAIAVAGKNASNTARSLASLLEQLPAGLPLANIANIPQAELAGMLKSAGMGCYNQRAKSFHDVAGLLASGLDLRACKPSELEQAWGIGPKTSRFFVMYTRDEYGYAILDTHVLKWMKSIGYDSIPTSTPRGKKYEYYEGKFLFEAYMRGLSPLELDKQIWQKTQRRIYDTVLR